MEIKFTSMVLLLFFVRAIMAVKINQISIPSYYLKDDSSKPLILDCDFAIDNGDEKGFVLKWQYNSVNIYQWIPPNHPFALGPFRGRINLNYTASTEENKKYSALSIIDPTTADAGNFTCSVQSFLNSDKKSAPLVIIHPENSIDLKYSIDEANQIVNLECSVYNIYPLPEVKFLFDEEEKSISVETDVRELKNLFNITITSQVSKNDITDESPLTCYIKINETEYEKKETIIYDDPKQTSTTNKSIDGENLYASKYHDENASMVLRAQLGIYLIVLFNLITTRWNFSL